MDFRSVLIILAILVGIICKVYDDLNDNAVFFESNCRFFRDNKLYINEFLKSVFGFILTFLSTFTIFPLLFFVVFNWIQYIMQKGVGFEEPYEYSGLYSSTILLVFMMIYHGKDIFSKNTFYSIGGFIGGFVYSYAFVYLFDVCLTPKTEFSYQKALVRGYFSVLNVFLMCVNYYYRFFSWFEFNASFAALVGYTSVSTIFQLVLCFHDECRIAKNIFDEKIKLLTYVNKTI